MSIRQWARAGAAALATAGLLVAGPSAIAAGPDTTVNHYKNVTETFVDAVPACELGEPSHEITLTYNAVEKESIFDNGDVHATFTQTGKFSATPLDPSGQTASGKVTIWGGFNWDESQQRGNGTFTFSVVGSLADGTRINNHVVEHFNSTPGGAEFFWTKCHD